MLTKDFWYDLPTQKIAQHPANPRDSSKLMILNCVEQKIKEDIFHNINNFLVPGDLLIINNSKVFKARLHIKINESLVEIFLLQPLKNQEWMILAKPGKKLKINQDIIFNKKIQAKVINKNTDGTIIIQFNVPHTEIFNFAEQNGETPIPPYIKQQPKKSEDYQTVYAKQIGSVAAPTAGFHFTPELITKLKQQGINFAEITLHVGLGTFRPVMTKTIEEHQMHSEWINIPQETQEIIKKTKQEKKRIIAVGTTALRALESGINEGFTNIFITPGYKFKTVDAMITNFHLPESTLLMLVSALAQSKINQKDAGRLFILQAYKQAIKNNFRFYSFGDAMFIF